MPDAQPELSGAPLALGIYGKMPAHGDFVRRGLPSSFVTPWDAWLSAGVAAARDQLAEGFAGVWDDAPAWRFSLPAGVCGPDAVAGVMLPSEDTVGRRFPLTAAALLPPGVEVQEAWFARLEAAVRSARQGAIDADGMIRAMQSSGEPEPAATSSDVLGMLGGGMAGVALGGPATAPAASGTAHWQAADPMDGPAEAASTAPGAGMWGDLLGESTAAPDPMEGPAPAPDAGNWGALLGDAPIQEPASAEGGLAGGGDIWGDLLGDAAPGDSATSPAPGSDWDDLIGDPAETRAASSGAQDPGQDDDATCSPGSGHGADPGAWDDLLSDSAAAPAAEPAPATMPALMATERRSADDMPTPEPVTASADVAPPPSHAPVRPPEGGWWTLGGARLAPMVWPLPDLPPAESFILLLHNQDPESGA
ncbi:MAG: type VI secretion system-associated protein TagF [Pseudomonadota bacterium]